MAPVTLDILFEQNWIQPRGRRRTPGRPATWVTTPVFLDHFGLAALDDLPGVDELRAAGLLDSEPTQAALDLRLVNADTLPDDDEEADGAGAAEDDPLDGEDDAKTPELSADFV